MNTSTKPFYIVFLCLFIYCAGMSFYFLGKLDEIGRKEEELAKQLAELQIHKEVEGKLKKQRKEFKELEAKLKQVEEEKHELHKELMSYKKVAYLTFDDGPSENTIKILDILKEQHIKATFFVNGRTDQTSIDTYKRIVDEGHAIGNHTYTHDYHSLYQSADRFIEDFQQLNQLLEEKAKIKTNIYRFPGGSNNSISYKYGGKGITAEIASRLKKKGYVFFDWNVDSMDSKARVVSKEEIVNNVLNGSKSQQQAIILMHDLQGKHTTVEALPDIINGLKEQGFAFDEFSEDSYNNQFLTVK